MKEQNEKKIKFGKTEVSEAELQESLKRLMEVENAKLEAEIEKNGEYVFSEKFERKMEEIMRVKTPEMKAAERRKKRLINAARYSLATVVTVLLLGGLIFTGNRSVNASKLSIDIKQWLCNAFVVENKASDDMVEDVLFEESQIGYLPEGFEKVEEVSVYSEVYLKYQNKTEDYVIFQVYRDKATAGIDNEEISRKVDLNTAGLEYQYVYKEEAREHVLNWIDQDGAYYLLSSSIEMDEIIKIMNNISY